MKDTLQAIPNMVGQRDPYTAGHEKRAGIVAPDIAREMGFPEDNCRNLQLIGLVHDIGKIGIPAGILTRPGRWGRLEYEVVKTHAGLSPRIVRHSRAPEGGARLSCI